MLHVWSTWLWNFVKMEYLSSVELNGEASRVSDGLRAATLMDNSWEASNERRLDPGCPEEIGAGEVSNVMGDLKETLCTGSPCMNNAFRDPLPVKCGDFFDEVIILKENWSCSVKIRVISLVEWLKNSLLRFKLQYRMLCNLQFSKSSHELAFYQWYYYYKEHVEWLIMLNHSYLVRVTTTTCWIFHSNNSQFDLDNGSISIWFGLWTE